MRLLLLTPVIFLMACGKGFEVKQSRSVEPELEEYVKHFEEVYNIAIDYPVEFKALEPGIAGKCRIQGNKRNVYINIDFYEWYQNNTGALHQLIFHELGHCSLLLNHNDTLDSNSEEISIMNSYAFGMYGYYLNNLDYYLESLIDYRAIPWNSHDLEWACKK